MLLATFVIFLQAGRGNCIGPNTGISNQHESFESVATKMKDDKLDHPAYKHIYNKYLAVRSGSSSKGLRILEIGLGCVNNVAYGKGHSYTPGRSLRVWQAWLPSAEIHMAEWDKECAEKFRPELGNKLYVGDQGDASFLQTIVDANGPHYFDVIIDDGGHAFNHMKVSFSVLFAKALKRGGLYIMEDTEGSFIGTNSNSPIVGSPMHMATDLANALTMYGRGGHNPDTRPFNEIHGVPSTVIRQKLVLSVDFYEDAVIFTKKPIAGSQAMPASLIVQ